MRPIALFSVNHRAPSRPVVIVPGSTSTPWLGSRVVPCGNGKSLVTPAGVISPTAGCSPAVRPSSVSVNHRFPSGPDARPAIVSKFPCTVNWVNTPAGVICPISLDPSANQIAPSGPAVSAWSITVALGDKEPWVLSWVTTPAVVIRLISSFVSLNQSAPSCPATIEVGVAGVPAVPADDPAGGGMSGTGNSVTTPAVVMRPTAPVRPANQSAPSGPTVIAVAVARVPAVPGAEPAGGGTAGKGNSVTTPAVVIRPISPGTPVNQRAPSGPAVIDVSVAGVLAVPGGDPAGGGTSGTANSVTTPAVVIRPTSPGTPTNQNAPSGPTVIAVGPGAGTEIGVGLAGAGVAGAGMEGSGNSVRTPPAVIRPILSAAVSVNQRLPSGPVVIPCGRTIPTSGIEKVVTLSVKSTRSSSPRESDCSTQEACSACTCGTGAHLCANHPDG
jgi:hypothetical protein